MAALAAAGGKVTSPPQTRSVGWTLGVLAGCCVVCIALSLLQGWQLQRMATLRQELQLQRSELQLQTGYLRSQLQRHQRRLDALEATRPDRMFRPTTRTRQRRSVATPARQTSQAGIPIVERPYGYRPGLHEDGPGMRVYDSFGEATEKPDSRTVLPHHRSSATFHQQPLGRVNSEPKPRPAAGATVQHRRSRVHQAASRAAQTRRGRHRRLPAKRVGMKRAKAKRAKMRETKSRQAAEARGAPVGFSPGPSPSSSNPRRHGRRLTRLKEELRKELLEELGTTAVHLEGHSSHYSLDHEHYRGNGILRNSHHRGMFVDWQPASWVSHHNYSRDFSLFDERLTVKKPGVYYVYAQINYLDRADVNGFEIMVSDQSFAKCLTMESSNHPQKINTCHTGGLTYLESGQSVYIKDMHLMRTSMFKPPRSFFGLLRLPGTGGEPGSHVDRLTSGWPARGGQGRPVF